MRFMIIVKASKNSEAGIMPSKKLLVEMGKFNEALARAGVLLAGEGLGFWMWQCNSKEEAIEWVKRCPNPHDGESEIEIRQVFEAEDFGAEFTPELREQEERVRTQISKKK